MSDKLEAIDPYDCGCTECIVGEYVPLRNATREQKWRLVKGELRNNTYDDVEITMRFIRDSVSAYIYFAGESWEITNPRRSINMLYFGEVSDVIDFSEVEVMDE